MSLNLYTYCSNNPIRFVDPSGHREVEGTTSDVRGDVTYRRPIRGGRDPQKVEPPKVVVPNPTNAVNSTPPATNSSPLTNFLASVAGEVSAAASELSVESKWTVSYKGKVGTVWPTPACARIEVKPYSKFLVGSYAAASGSLALDLHQTVTADDGNTNEQKGIKAVAQTISAVTSFKASSYATVSISGVLGMTSARNVQEIAKNATIGITIGTIVSGFVSTIQNAVLDSLGIK